MAAGQRSGPLVAILAAAGRGERLGGAGGAEAPPTPKAFVRCAGRPLLEWSIDALAAVCDRVVVAVPPGMAGEVAPRAGVDCVAGGRSRSESVAAAVAAAPDARAYVVQDAARPLVTARLVERCVAEIDRGWDGAVAAAPVTDTVKEAGADEAVARTLDRTRLWAAQTPQAFRGEALRDALAADADRLAAATDDASLVEAAGGRVRLVEAPAENVKVTRPVDLATAEALLRRAAGATC